MSHTPIHTLSALKRAIVPGVRIRVAQHWQKHLEGTWRTPERIQGNAYTFLAPDKEGKTVEQWSYHPKSLAEVKFNEDGSVTYFPGSPRQWTIEIHSAPTPSAIAAELAREAHKGA